MRDIELGLKLHPGQLEVAERIGRLPPCKRFAVVVAHRKFGKTTLAQMLLIQGALTSTRELPRYGYMAPRLKQAKDVSWMALLARLAQIPGIRKSESELWIELPHNGARIGLYGASEGHEEALRGLYFDGLVVDEYAQVGPNVWGEILRPTLMDRQGWCLFIGTPHGVDAFHALYHRALDDPDWYTALYRADETCLPWLPPEELELARHAMADAQYRQELLCDWSASSDYTLITIDLVSAATRREYALREMAYAPMVLGVDVARFGADRSVLQLRQGLHALEPVVYEGLDNMHLAGMVADVVAKRSVAAVFVDAGRGEGVIDRLRQLGHKQIHEINFGGKPLDERYADKRTEMWHEVKKWLEAGGALPNHSDLKTDLCGPTYAFTPAGKIKLESKDRMRERGLRSTDIGDALALTFAFPVASPDLHLAAGHRYVHRQRVATL